MPRKYEKWDQNEKNDFLLIKQIPIIKWDQNEAGSCTQCKDINFLIKNCNTCLKNMIVHEVLNT